MSKRKAAEKEPEDVEMASHEDDDSGSDGDEVGTLNATHIIHSFQLNKAAQLTFRFWCSILGYHQRRLRVL